MKYETYVRKLKSNSNKASFLVNLFPQAKFDFSNDEIITKTELYKYKKVKYSYEDKVLGLKLYYQIPYKKSYILVNIDTPFNFYCFLDEYKQKINLVDTFLYRNKQFLDAKMIATMKYKVGKLIEKYPDFKLKITGKNNIFNSYKVFL